MACVFDAPGPGGTGGEVRVPERALRALRGRISAEALTKGVRTAADAGGKTNDAFEPLASRSGSARGFCQAVVVLKSTHRWTISIRSDLAPAGKCGAATKLREAVAARGARGRRRWRRRRGGGSTMTSLTTRSDLGEREEVGASAVILCQAAVDGRPSHQRRTKTAVTQNPGQGSR